MTIVKYGRKISSVAVLLAVSIILSFSVIPVIPVSAADTDQKTDYSYLLADKEFENNSVIVVLKKSGSIINKSITKASFSGVDIIKIEDLTRVPNYGREETAVNEEEFQQILKITLKESGNESILDAIAKLNSFSVVESVTPNYRIRFDTGAAAEDPMISGEAVSGTPVLPNDPSYADQYALPRISAPQAWNYSTGSPSVAVAVIDTGIDIDHPDLAPNIFSKSGEIPNNGRDDDGNGYVDDYHGWNFVSNNPNPADDHGHGTHVAGIIGAVGNNNIGISGVCWNVKLVPIKVLDSGGYGDFDDIAAAITYAMNLNVPIINASFGAFAEYMEITNAIKNYSGLFVAAAGNYSVNTDIAPFHPACADSPNVISVASTSSADDLSYFSNYGSVSVDLAAPGEYIYSAVIDAYGYKSGTSMAAPYVSGAAALIKSLNPLASTSDLKNAILWKADKIDSLTDVVATGGRLNVMEALTFFVLSGDVSQDGVLTALDVTILRQHLLEPYLTGNALLAADVNGDGEVSALDVMALRKLLLES